MDMIIGGALGRMGREVVAAAQENGVNVLCGVDVACCGQPMPCPMVSGYEQVKSSSGVIVDFSRPDALEELLRLAETHKMPVVLCTTGYTLREMNRIEEAARKIAVLKSANMSLGAHVLCELVRLAARALDGFDIEIVEKHHRLKADSPSGTAMMLFEAAQKETGSMKEPVCGRYGRMEKRGNEIGLHAVRGGTVTGVHEVGFYGSGEQLLLTHRAENRALFAQGALRAAAFVKDKPPGLYDMGDVVRQLLG